MTREKLIAKTLADINKLPDQKLKEISEFAEFLLSKIDDKIILEGIQKLSTETKAFKFLEDEEDIYKVEDLKEKYKRASSSGKKHQMLALIHLKRME